MTITLELGHFYRTRDGFRCGPMEGVKTDDVNAACLLGYIKGTGVRSFKIDDGAHAYGESALDLVAEWVDEPEAPAPEQSEAEAIADERWDANDLEAARAAVFDNDGVALLSTAHPVPDDLSSESLKQAEINIAEEHYKTLFTNVPPVLSVRDGHLIISLTNGPLTLEASVGDGRYFFSQVVEHLINPALLARQTTHAFASKWMREHGIGSPND